MNHARRLFNVFCLLLVLLPAQLYAFAPPAQIKVEAAEWGDASPEDVQAVLNSVIETISPYIATRHFGTVIVRHSTDVPRSLNEKGANGEYIVQLAVSGRQWAQFAYQFSHEMCHLMSNYDLAPNNASHQQWFEESLCEAFSLFTLEKLGQQWETNPPYPNWQEYAPHFSEYERDNLQQAHRKLPDGVKLSDWYQQNSTLLSADPYAQDRHLNELLSNRLLAIFVIDPDKWAAINYLNLGDDSTATSLDKHLQDWQDNAPPDLRTPVESIRQLLLKPQ
jgi:hypothetical protein